LGCATSSWSRRRSPCSPRRPAFYVQHQFEHTYWAWDADWNLHTGALHGSSHYDLPPVLRWFTANIGIHHVHHLASRIPCYRFGEALRDHPELRAVSRLTLAESFRCLRLARWDEDRRRLVGFGEARSSAGGYTIGWQSTCSSPGESTNKNRTFV
jgi:acyl-lipid omega-6 desaturase (Delta-12 desaturase)